MNRSLFHRGRAARISLCPYQNGAVDLVIEAFPAGEKTVAVYRALRAAIVDGRLPSGHRLPATRTLAIDLGVSRGSVATAYERLVAEGYLTSRVGSGTFVAPVPASKP